MRSMLCGWLLLCGATASADEAALVESFLYQGQYNLGEQTLDRRLEAEPNDDQARFGLGVLQVLRGVERLGQGLHEYGVKAQNSGELFIRLPVPDNPDPAPINYQLLRQLLDDFRRDLERAEATLAGVKEEQVKLPLRLGSIKFDLDHDGKATDTLLTVMQRLDRGNRLERFEKNPELQVTFDRGDVAWLRAYCHLLMGFLDGYLAVDNEGVFNLRSDTLFAKPKHPFVGTDEERREAWTTAYASARMSEPLRWHRTRLHFLQAAKLNKETWDYIRKETDDDHEWLPNARQVSMLGLRVQDRMIDAWLAMWGELEALFDGTKVFPIQQLVGPDKKRKPNEGISFHKLMEDPPERINDIRELDAKYFTEEPAADIGRLIGWYFSFGASPIPFAVWFN